MVGNKCGPARPLVNSPRTSPGGLGQVKETVELRHYLRYFVDVVVACTKYNVSFLLMLVAINRRFTHYLVTSSSFFGGE